jgi:long-subunit acyl-CoA synthetase (AMP-forming)
LCHYARYLFDPEATANAHDSEGYFKTGDVARRRGRYYFILGREDVDGTLFTFFKEVFH